MTAQIGLLLLILAVGLILFILEWVSADVVALGMVLALVVTGLLPAEKAFAGFGSETVMLILGLLILTAALLRTGVMDRAGRLIVRRAGGDPHRLLLFILVGTATLSAFISNTAATAFFLPLTMGVVAKTKVSPSKLLMPLAFGSVLSSSVTLISTSTNIVVSGLMTRYGLRPLSLFELSPIGIPIAVAGIAYMLLLGRRLIPDRRAAEERTDFGLRPYLSEVLVLPDSPLVGKTLAESGLGHDLDLTVLQIVRGGRGTIAPRANTRLAAGDTLVVEGLRDNILKVKDVKGIEIRPEVTLPDAGLQSDDAALVEVILMPRSPLLGRTLRGVAFRDRYGLQVLAINRRGATIRQKLANIRLKLGDVLLLQGHRSRVAALDGGGTMRVLAAVDGTRPNTPRAPLALAIFALSLVLGALHVLPLPVAALLGALTAFLTRCITPEEAYRIVDWRVLILIGSMLAVGTAMEETGAATYLAGHLVRAAGSAGPIWMLTAVFALTVILTQPMSNAAAAVLILPVAVQTALQLHLNPRTFAVMVAVAASTSYMTPLEPSCLMVYGPGRYRFADFAKVGGILTVLIYGISIALVPLIWPP